jgi:acrylyl-CoA reductase (NADPH)
VGSVATCLLARLGAEVVAFTGTEAAHDMLLRLGASRVVDRSDLGEPSKRPLAAATWAGAVDVAGGPTLANLVKQTRVGGAVASCGMVQSADVALSVFPFILRGVGLLGIDSEKAPLAVRTEVWNRFAGPWRLDLEPIVTEVTLEELDPYVDAILAGETVGRVRVAVDPA